MDITLLYKENSYKFNVSPLMPISYLRTLSNKTFHIPEYLVNLAYKDIIIEKQYNETSLKEYFNDDSNVLVDVSEIKTIYKNLNSISLKGKLKLKKQLLMNENKTINEENNKINYTDNNITNHYHSLSSITFNKKNSEHEKKEKCEDCKERIIEYYCRESNKFLCKICKNSNIHFHHKTIKILKGNFEQLGFLYQKELIKDLNNQEKEVKDLIEKSNHERIDEKVEEIYDIIESLNKLERDIMENFPCNPITNIINIDYSEIRKNIFSIHNDFQKNNNPYIFKDKKNFFKQLQNEDFKLDDLQKDIDNIKKKFNIQDILFNILSHIYNNLKDLNDSLLSIYNNNSYNLILFEKEIEKILKKSQKKFNIKNENETDSFSEEEKEKFENELEEIIFESKNGNLKKKIILPKLINRNLFPSNKVSGQNLLHNINIRSRRVLSGEKINKNNLLKKNNSSSSSNSIEEKKNKFIKSNFTERNNRESNFQIDSQLISDEKRPKRPRKNSIRMSIFTKNMNKVDTLTQKIMKVKKKKKKY